MSLNFEPERTQNIHSSMPTIVFTSAHASSLDHSVLFEVRLPYHPSGHDVKISEPSGQYVPSTQPTGSEIPRGQ